MTDRHATNDSTRQARAKHTPEIPKPQPLKKGHKKTESMCIMPTPIYLVEDASTMAPPPHLTNNDINGLLRDANRAADESSLSSDEEDMILVAPRIHPNRHLFEPDAAYRFHYDIEEEEDEEEDEEETDDESTIPPPPPPEEDTSSYNALFLLLGNLKQILRFMRVDVENLPHHNRVVSMRVRVENMEALIDDFEDMVIRNGLHN